MQIPVPAAVDRATFQSELDALRVREKALAERQTGRDAWLQPWLQIERNSADLGAPEMRPDAGIGSA
jgi:hypothetical protein